MLYQLSYQGIARPIAQGLLAGKAFLCFFTLDLDLSQSIPYCGACSGDGTREVHQILGSAGQGSGQPVFAGGPWRSDDSRRNIQLPAGAWHLDVADRPSHSVDRLSPGTAISAGRNCKAAWISEAKISPSRSTYGT
jgi:hypothetical protein